MKSFIMLPEKKEMYTYLIPLIYQYIVLWWKKCFASTIWRNIKKRISVCSYWSRTWCFDWYSQWISILWYNGGYRWKNPSTSLIFYRYPENNNSIKNGHHHHDIDNNNNNNHIVTYKNSLHFSAESLYIYISLEF